MTETQYRLLARVSGNVGLLPIGKVGGETLRALVDAVKAGRGRARLVLLGRDPMAIADALTQAADRLRVTGHTRDASDAEELAFLMVMWNRRGVTAGPFNVE